MRTRFAGWSEDEIAESLAWLELVRDRVLENARIVGDQAVADVGAGTGLLTLGALACLGEDGTVIALDPSVDCLQELEQVCRDPRVWYQVGAAAVLPLPDSWVDAALTRSALIYEQDKAEAARELFRVLRPGGRVSIFEPINRRNLRLHELVDFGPLQERVAAYEERCYASDDPMVNFDVDDLVCFFAGAGFSIEHEVGQRVWDAEPQRVLYGIGAPGRVSQIDEWRREFSEEDVSRLAASVEAAGPTLPLRYTHVLLWGEKPE